MSSTPENPVIAEPLVDQPLSSRILAGFWRRFIAFAIDGIITGIVCFILGYFLLGSIGVWGAAVGFVLTLTYFAVMGSYVCEGQTIGQGLLNIQVIGRDGEYLSVERSYLRYSILLLPLLGSQLLGWLPISIEVGLGYVFAALMIGLIYLAIFNRGSRQTIHDLATDSYVVKEGGYGRLCAPSIWRWHLWIVGGVVVLAMVSMIPAVQKKILRHGVMAELWTVQEAVVDSGAAPGANVELVTGGAGHRGESGLRITVSAPESGDYQDASARIVQAALKADPAIASRDYVAVVFNEGFEVGFARMTRTSMVSHSPQEWEEIIRVKLGQ